MYYRNPDENLRALQRNFQATDADSDLLAWNAARERAGLEPVKRIPPFGSSYYPGLPATATAAFGARMIIEGGAANFAMGHSNYRSVDQEAEAVLRNLLSDQNNVRQFREEARRLISQHVIERDKPNEVVLLKNEELTVLANSNGSHGYLYIIAFLTPEYEKTSLPTCEDLDCNAERISDLLEECIRCHSKVCVDKCGRDCEECDGFTCYRCLYGGVKCDSCEDPLCSSKRCDRQVYECKDCGRIYCPECKSDIISEGCECSEIEICEYCNEEQEICDECGSERCSCSPCSCVQEEEEGGYY